MQAPVGERVRRVRRAQDLTQEHLAKRAGLSVITISRLENGTARAVYADTVVALADALGISADYLLGRSAEVCHCTCVDPQIALHSPQFSSRASLSCTKVGHNEPQGLSEQTKTGVPRPAPGVLPTP